MASSHGLGVPNWIRRGQLSTDVSLSLIPNGEHHVTWHLTLPQPWLLSWWVTSNCKPKQVFLSLCCFCLVSQCHNNETCHWCSVTKWSIHTSPSDEAWRSRWKSWNGSLAFSEALWDLVGAKSFVSRDIWGTTAAASQPFDWVTSWPPGQISAVTYWQQGSFGLTKTYQLMEPANILGCWVLLSCFDLMYSMGPCLALLCHFSILLDSISLTSGSCPVPSLGQTCIAVDPDWAAWICILLWSLNTGMAAFPILGPGP